MTIRPKSCCQYVNRPIVDAVIPEDFLFRRHVEPSQVVPMSIASIYKAIKTLQIDFFNRFDKPITLSVLILIVQHQETGFAPNPGITNCRYGLRALVAARKH